MAIAAVRIRLQRATLAFRLIGFCLVLVTMMAEVLHGLPLFMLAIRRSRRPGKLERQNHQQENKKQFFHRQDNSIE